MITLKEETITNYTFTTTDGKEFSGTDKELVLGRAQYHQDNLEIAAAKKQLSLDLWKYFGLDESFYKTIVEENYLVWSVDANAPEEKVCHQITQILTDFDTADETFADFVDMIYDNYISKNAQVAGIMSLVAKYVTKEK